MSKIPHKHAALIKAWADGAKIQMKWASGWTDWDHPDWSGGEGSYRIKPEPKPDVVMYARASIPYAPNLNSVYRTRWSFECNSSDNLKATFNGDTGVLKSVEIIK